MHVEPHQTPEELAALIRRETDARLARRLIAVRFDERPEDIGPRVLLGARQVRLWVGRYNEVGLGGLSDLSGRLRPGPLDNTQAKQLTERLRAGPTPADGVCTPRGEDVRRILREEFGVARCLQAVYDLLHRLDFEPRARHPFASAEAQADFKKASPPASRRSPRPAPASPSISGSRTRPASGRRVR